MRERERKKREIVREREREIVRERERERERESQRVTCVLSTSQRADQLVF